MTRNSVEMFSMNDLEFFTPGKDVESLGDWRSILEKNLEQGHWIIGFWDKERLVSIFGARTMYPGIGEIWQFNSNDIESCSFSLAKKMKRTLDLVLAPVMGYHRIQGVCSPGDKFVRWAKFFGMEQEGVLKSFFKPGEDMLLFARVFN